jgi:hypothetical protein
MTKSGRVRMMSLPESPSRTPLGTPVPDFLSHHSSADFVDRSFVEGQRFPPSHLRKTSLSRMLDVKIFRTPAVKPIESGTCGSGRAARSAPCAISYPGPLARMLLGNSLLPRFQEKMAVIRLTPPRAISDLGKPWRSEGRSRLRKEYRCCKR